MAIMCTKYVHEATADGACHASVYVVVLGPEIFVEEVIHTMPRIR